MNHTLCINETFTHINSVNKLSFIYFSQMLRFEQFKKFNINPIWHFCNFEDMECAVNSFHDFPGIFVRFMYLFKI